MRAPATKSLMRAFSIDARSANLIRRLAKATNSGAELKAIVARSCPSTERYVNSMHSSPYGSHMWRVTVALHAINEIVDGNGVEGLGEGRGPSYAPPVEYINMGDPYAATLIYRRSSDNLYIGSWGDTKEAQR